MAGNVPPSRDVYETKEPLIFLRLLSEEDSAAEKTDEFIKPN